MKCEETNQHDLIRYGYTLSDLVPRFLCKDRTLSGENVLADQSPVFDGYTNVLLLFFHAVAAFYLHVTVFTKEHEKHANKGELIYR